MVKRIFIRLMRTNAIIWRSIFIEQVSRNDIRPGELGAASHCELHGYTPPGNTVDHGTQIHQRPL